MKDDLLLFRYIPNGCEVDLTIPETFPIEPLLEFIDAFINVSYNNFMHPSIIFDSNISKYCIIIKQTDTKIC